MVTINFRLW